MRTTSSKFQHARGARRSAGRPTRCLLLESLEQRCVLSGGPGFVETSLVSDIPGLAAHTDPAVVNPWGFTETPRGEFFLSDNGGGTAALFAADGTPLGAPVVIPPPVGSLAGATSTPNGQVENATADFVITEGDRSAPAANLFSTEDGTIAGFNSAVDPSQAIIAADQSASGAVYKLLAMGRVGGANYLYATDFHNDAVAVFDKNFVQHTFLAGQFTDPHAPTGFAPFGVKNINGVLFVTYAKQDADMQDDVAGPGNGFIDRFDESGHFLSRFASGTAAGGTLTALNSPIGMTIAPEGFGNFGGDLLVGNFGDSHVSAFNLRTGRFLGQLQDTRGQPLALDAGVTGADGNTKGLWGIAFGNGQGGAGLRTMFFAAGPNDESDGVFGLVNMAGKNHGHEHNGFRTKSDLVLAASANNGTSLHMVSSPPMNHSMLSITATNAENHAGVVGGMAGTQASAEAMLAEQFRGTSHSVAATDFLMKEASFGGVAGKRGGKR